MRNMPNINFLRYFYSAGKHQSMSKAAQENFVTQSAISQGISKLEIELGVKLLTDAKNRVELTPDGVSLLEKCEGVFALFSDIEDFFNAKEGVYQGKLLFATSHSFALSLLPFYYKELLIQHPNVEPVLRLGHSGIVREWVSKGEIEFGIVLAKEEDFSTFRTQAVLKGEYGLYTAKKKKGKVLDRLIVSTDMRDDNIFLKHLREKKMKVPPLIEVLSWEVIAGMIEEGLGVGVLPDYVANRHGLLAVKTKMPALTYQIIAITSKRKSFSRNASMFINLMTQT